MTGGTPMSGNLQMVPMIDLIGMVVETIKIHEGWKETLPIKLDTATFVLEVDISQSLQNKRNGQNGQSM